MQIVTMHLVGFPMHFVSGKGAVKTRGLQMALDALIGIVRDNLGAVIAVIAAVVASIGALMSRVETRRQRTIQLENLRYGIDGQSISWGNACIDTLGRAAIFARTRQHQKDDAAFLHQRVNLMLALSSLMERGRLFFPNIDGQGKGVEKEGAYRGSLPPILAALMLAYQEVDAMDRTDGPTADNSGDFLDDCRRLIVSEVQVHLDPRRRDVVLKRYNAQPPQHRSDAQARAETLKNLLKSRRPGVDVDQRGETVQ